MLLKRHGSMGEVSWRYGWPVDRLEAWRVEGARCSPAALERLTVAVRRERLPRPLDNYQGEETRRAGLAIMSARVLASEPAPNAPQHVARVEEYAARVAAGGGCFGPRTPPRLPEEVEAELRAEVMAGALTRRARCGTHITRHEANVWSLP